MRRHSEAGFTLLELLLVVAILSSLALAATTFVDNADNQERFEVTRSRLEQIRFAVVGDSRRTANGQAELSGFVADMGRLPNNLEELLSRPNDCDPDMNGIQTCAWSFGETGGIWRGWRGPYLDTLTGRDGSRKFLDGWGNVWGRFEISANRELVVQSKGADGVGNPSVTAQYLAQNDYEKDFPRSPDTSPNQLPEPLIIREDYELTLTDSFGKGGLTVNLVKPYDGTCATPNETKTNKAACEAAGGTWTFSTYSLCLRLYYRKHGTTAFLDADNNGTVNVTKDGNNEIVTLRFPNNTTVPIGMATVDVRTDDTGSPNSCLAIVKSAGALALPVLFASRAATALISIQLIP